MEPVTKKRKAASSELKHAGGSDDDSEDISGDPWTCKAQNAMHFKIVRREADMTSDAREFSPVFTHQIFEEERIRGYRNLKIELMMTASTLFTYLNIEYEEKKADADDVVACLHKWMAPGYTQSPSEFKKMLRPAKFTPWGKRVHSYTARQAPGDPWESQTASVSYEIYLSSFRKIDAASGGHDSKSAERDDDTSLHGGVSFEEFHSRLQLFLLFYIEAGSYIDTADANWEVLVVFERRVLRDKTVSYSIVGYCTLYTFFAYPNMWKFRISQFLILPPFQKCGHGRQILQTVYKLTAEREYALVLVEDPSPGFQFLRDLTDMEMCIERGFFQSQELVWNEDYAKRVQLELRIRPEQVRRCYEAFKLRLLEGCEDEKQLKAYRLEVKARLYKINQEELLVSFSNAADRKAKLHSYYEEQEEQYQALLQRLKPLN